MINEHKFLTLRDGVEIHTRIREVGSPVWLIVTHGIGEHLERHNYLLDMFSHDFNVFQYDLRGHGRSMGKAGYVESFEDYIRDLDEIISNLQVNYKMSRYVLFGHSMGALISAGYLQSFAKEDLYPERVFFSAPPVMVPGVMGSFIKMAPMKFMNALSSLPFSVPLGGLVDLKNLSHDIRVYENYINDEFNHLKLHSKLLLELVTTSKRVFSRPLRVKCPAYCAVGEHDRIVDVQSVEHYFTQVEKTFYFKKFPDAYHEMHNEIDKYRKPYFEFLKNSILETLYKDV